MASTGLLPSLTAQAGGHRAVRDAVRGRHHRGRRGHTGDLGVRKRDDAAAQLPPATAYAVIVGWAVVLVVAGGIALARRDA
jgi:hypothetical protein